MCRGVMAANPALAGMLDGNPRLKQLLTSPDAMQSMLSGAYRRAATLHLKARHFHLYAASPGVRHVTFSFGSRTLSPKDLRP